ADVVERGGRSGAVTDVRARKLRRGTDDPIGGEACGTGAVRTVADDEREVGFTGVFQTGGDTDRAEAGGCGDAHGATPSVPSPARSSRPRATVIACTAAPAVPSPRLSIAQTMTTRPARSSTATCTSAVFAPRVIAVEGHCPSGRRSMKGSSA